MKTKHRYTRPGFEGIAERLGAIDRELRLDELREGRQHDRAKIVPHGKDKARCPRRQRKQRDWNNATE